MQKFLLLGLIVTLLLPLGCRRRGQEYDAALPPGAVGIRQVQPKNWPRLTFPAPQTQARSDLTLGIDRSLVYMSKPSSQTHYPVGPVQHRQVVQGLERLKELLQSDKSSAEITNLIQREFLCYSAVGYDDKGTVLFTGYYTPIFAGSRTPNETFRFPLHKKPADLVPGATHLTVAKRQVTPETTEPYPTRAQINQGNLLQGQELIYLADEFDAYIVNVQGSGRIRLQDGSLIEIGYDGTNGYDYHPISDDLIADGIINEENRNLESVRAYFRQHPDAVRRYIDKNPRYIFFTETKGGPYGSLGQPVVANVSIATDKTIFPRAAPVFLKHNKGRGIATNGWRLDQDTGGAIRAAGRCDLYFGIGDQAERRAGQQFSFGRMYYFVRR